MRRPLFVLQTLAAIVSCALLVVFLTGRVLTDRFLFSQYLFWIPSIILVPGALAPALLAASLGWFRPRRRARTRRGRSAPDRLTRLALGGSAAAAVFVLGAEWRLYALLIPRPDPPPDGVATPTLRLLHWNMVTTSVEIWTRSIAAIPTDPPFDLLLISNPIWAGGYFAQLPEALGPDYHVRHTGPLAILSRDPILRSGFISLGIPGATAFTPETPEEGDVPGILPEIVDFLPPRGAVPDSGAALFVEIDTNHRFGRTTVVWLLDLPSDARLPRREVARLAAARLFGPGAIGETDGDAGDEDAGEHAGRAFPSPDIIAGDFNIPRGSSSLELLAPGMSHAFGQAGVGPAASYPGRFPLSHIDHVFIGRGMRATEYKLLDPKFGDHHMQIVELVGSATER